jgi:hypothetical protein
VTPCRIDAGPPRAQRLFLLAHCPQNLPFCRKGPDVRGKRFDGRIAVFPRPSKHLELERGGRPITEKDGAAAAVGEACVGVRRRQTVN